MFNEAVQVARLHEVAREGSRGWTLHTAMKSCRTPLPGSDKNVQNRSFGLYVFCFVLFFFFLSQRLMDMVKFNLVLLEVEEGCALKLV